MYPSRAILTSSHRLWKIVSVEKIFMCLIFVVVGHRRNIFNDENFPIYGTKYTVYMSLTWTRQWEIRQDHWWLQACQMWQSCWWRASELQSSWQYQYVGLTSSEGARTKAMHSWKERSNNASLRTYYLAVALFPGPHPASCRLQYSYYKWRESNKANLDEKGQACRS